MHPQIEQLLAEFRQSRERLHALATSVSDSDWSLRAAPEAWSIGECIAHLVLTGHAYLPILDAGLAEARALGGGMPRHMRRDPIGWLLWRTMGPPVRLRTKTMAAFVPSSGLPRLAAVDELRRIQDEEMRRVRDADGLPIHRVRVTSPFDARVRYSLWSCFGILARHEHRHLWQAERVRDALQPAARGRDLAL